MRDWVDLTRNNVFTAAQLKRRKVAHIRSKYSVEDEIELLRGLIRGGREDQKYRDWLEEVEAAEQKATVDNALLKETIKLEKAQRRLSKYTLSVGVKERIGVPEVKVEEEVTQEEIIAIAPIEPLSPTIKVTDEEGKVTNIKNPLISKDEAEREKAQKIIDEVGTEALNLVQLRRNNESKRD